MRMIKIRRTLVYLKFLVLLSDVIIGGFCMEPFIVGGVGASIQAFPHSVFLSAENVDHHFEWICGSSVLNQMILLTAAHCIVDCQTQMCALTAFAGSEDIRKATASRKVKNYLVHEDYSSDSVTCDIGLVGLEKEFPLGNTIKRVLIPKIYKKAVNTANMAGWGVINDKTYEETVILQMLKQHIHNSAYCSTKGLLDEESTFCAGFPDKTKPHPASGDSGSALMVNHYVQIGVVSYKPVNTAITIYTNTTYFYTWIQDSTKILLCTE